MTPEQLEEYKLVRDALATQAGEELSRTRQSTDTGASDTNITGQTSGDITGN